MSSTVLCGSKLRPSMCKGWYGRQTRVFIQYSQFCELGSFFLFFAREHFHALAKHYICDSAALHWDGSALMLYAWHVVYFTRLPFQPECAVCPSGSGPSLHRPALGLGERGRWSSQEAGRKAVIVSLEVQLCVSGRPGFNYYWTSFKYFVCFSLSRVPDMMC
jgi:hypothetical protein